MKIFACIIICCLFNNIACAQIQKDVFNKLLGNWEYDVSYDTIGVVDTLPRQLLNELKYPLFITEISIKKDQAVLSDGTTTVKTKWNLLDGNRIQFAFGGNQYWIYEIVVVTDKRLELKEIDNALPSLPIPFIKQ